MLAPLEGFVVGVTADRRADEQRDLLERRGARVFHGPVIRTLPLTSDDALRDATRRVVERPPDYVIANTGIGIRGWLTAAAAWDCEETLTAVLARARVLARGPKAAGALHSIGVDVWWRAPDESLEEIVTRLLDEPMTDRTVAFQRHGGDTPGVTDALRAVGAEVIEIPVYRWMVPDERLGPYALIDRVCSGDVDAVTFTSAPALMNFLELAREQGAEDAVRSALNSRIVTAVIGPYCAQKARSVGLEQLVEPRTARLGSMVRALTECLRRERVVVRADDRTVTVQGRAVEVVDESGLVHEAWLSSRERRLFDRLLCRPGSVVSRAELCKTVWGEPGHDHALDVTVARLRRRLADAGSTVETVAKRGYRVTARAVPQAHDADP